MRNEKLRLVRSRHTVQTSNPHEKHVEKKEEWVTETLHKWQKMLTKDRVEQVERHDQKRRNEVGTDSQIRTEVWSSWNVVWAPLDDGKQRRHIVMKPRISKRWMSNHGRNSIEISESDCRVKIKHVSTLWIPETGLGQGVCSIRVDSSGNTLYLWWSIRRDHRMIVLTKDR